MIETGEGCDWVGVLVDREGEKTGGQKRGYIHCASDQHIWQLFGEDISSPMIGRRVSANRLSKPHAAIVAVASTERIRKDLETNTGSHALLPLGAERCIHVDSVTHSRSTNDWTTA